MDVDSKGSWEPPASGRKSDRVRTYRIGRVCAEPGCTTVLSIYNPSSKCAVHQRQGIVVQFRRLESQQLRRHCVQCGAQFMTTNPRRKYCSPRCRSHAFAERERAMRRAVLAAAQERLAA